MGTHRGSPDSNVNEKDDQWSLEERWNFNLVDMKADLTAFIEKVLEVTGKPKLTLISYSQGTTISMIAIVKD